METHRFKNKIKLALTPYHEGIKQVFWNNLMGFNTLIAVMLSLLIVGCKVPVGPSPKAATHGDVKTTLLVLLKDLAMFVSFSCQAFLERWGRD
jgi:hypothetical protein